MGLSFGFKSQVNQVLQITTLISIALLIWGALCLWTGSESPMVVVLSGSMEPGYYRGDMLALNMPSSTHPLDIGDVVVFKLGKDEVPIVHRYEFVCTLHRDSLPHNPCYPPLYVALSSAESSSYTIGRIFTRWP